MVKTQNKKKNKTSSKQYSISEEQLIETIEIISKNLAYKFKFGYHELEDMKQQISIYAIEGLEKYDYERPLENFLWTHVRNRLFNFKRDNYQRPDKPCNTCPFYNAFCADASKDCTEFSNKFSCKQYAAWHKRNSVKKNLMYLNTIEEIKESIPNRTKHNYDDIENKELINRIEENLFDYDRELYLKLKNGIKIGKKELSRLSDKIKELFND